MKDGDDVEWVCKGNADGPCASSELIIASIRHILLVSEKSDQNPVYRRKLRVPNISEFSVSTILKVL